MRTNFFIAVNGQSSWTIAKPLLIYKQRISSISEILTSYFSILLTPTRLSVLQYTTNTIPDRLLLQTSHQSTLILPSYCHFDNNLTSLPCGITGVASCFKTLMRIFYLNLNLNLNLNPPANQDCRRHPRHHPRRHPRRHPSRPLMPLHPALSFRAKSRPDKPLKTRICNHRASLKYSSL